MMYDLLRSRAAALTQPAIDLLVELIQTPSLSLQEHQVAGVVERTMRVFGFDRVVRDDYGNVLGLMLGRESGPTLLAISHLDTVAADFPDAWQRSPQRTRASVDHLALLPQKTCARELTHYARFAPEPERLRASLELRSVVLSFILRRVSGPCRPCRAHVGYQPRSGSMPMARLSRTPNATAAASSVRRVKGPSVTATKPASAMSARSAGAHPPSGPTVNTARRSVQPGCRA